MPDAGIELLIPQYSKNLLRQADTAYWEVLYKDGTVLCEAQGASILQCDREKLASFRLIHKGEIVFEAAPPVGKTGRHLIYRRVSTIGVGRDVWFIIGWAPDGPYFGIDVDHGRWWEDTPGIAKMIKPMLGDSVPYLLPPRRDIG